jgi:transcriptional regulator
LYNCQIVYGALRGVQDCGSQAAATGASYAVDLPPGKTSVESWRRLSANRPHFGLHQHHVDRRKSMYTPPAFREDDPTEISRIIREARLATLVTATAEGLVATPLPLILDESEGEHGVLYGHLAKANPQWKLPSAGDALVIFSGPDAYVTPSWYAAKAEHGKVVPTWNYVAVHVYGPVEYFDDEDRLHDAVTRLTNLHEQERQQPWAVTDAPEPFIKSQLKGIVGLRLPITRIEGKRKMSQNRSELDRQGVALGLSASDRESDRAAARLVPRTS